MYKLYEKLNKNPTIGFSKKKKKKKCIPVLYNRPFSFTLGVWSTAFMSRLYTRKDVRLNIYLFFLLFVFYLKCSENRQNRFSDLPSKTSVHTIYSFITLCPVSKKKINIFSN